MVDYGIEAKKKVEADTADIERFFVEEGYINQDALVERPPVVTIMGHAGTMVKQPSLDNSV